MFKKILSLITNKRLANKGQAEKPVIKNFGDTVLVKRKNGNGFFRMTKDGKTIKDFTVKDLRTLLINAGYRLSKMTKEDYEDEKLITYIKSDLWRVCLEKGLL